GSSSCGGTVREFRPLSRQPTLESRPSFKHRFHVSSRAGFSIMKIYVGNLPFDTNEDSLRAAFEPYGEVASASIVTDRETGRPRGFGFVEMNSDEQAKAAIAALHGSNMG